MIGKKLVCKHQKMDKEDFMENISDFDSRFELFFFILNTLLHTMHNGWWWYYCKRKKGAQKN